MDVNNKPNDHQTTTTKSTTNIQQHNETHLFEINIQTIKEYLQSKGGKCKYSDIFDHFRESLIDQKTNERFHEILAKIADKKCDNDNKYQQEEWSLKKKYNTSSHNNNDTTIQSPNSASAATSFFANTLQKTRKNLNKIEHRLTTAFNTKTIMNQQQQSSTNNNKNDDLTKTELTTTTTTTTTTTLNPTLLTTTTTTTVTTGDNNETKENEQPSQDRNVKSVKEHAKKLNRLNTESELKRAAAQQTSPASASSSIMNNAIKYKPKINASNARNIELESFDVSNLKPHEKEWIFICSKPDSYMDIAKLLSKNPELAQKKDPFNGYTCAHWGCKHGNIEIIKLLASSLENDTKTNPKSIRIQHLINSRTKAGYTCLHISYIFGNTDLISTLNQYGGHNLIDYSGKLGIEYSLGSNDFIVIDAAERKPTLLDFTNDANALIRRSTTMMQIKDKRESSSMFYMDPTNSKETENNEDGENDSRRNTIRPESTRTTPSASPARSSIDTTISTDSQIMPPPKTNIIPRSKQAASSVSSSFEDLTNTTCSQSTTSIDDIKSIESEEKK